MREFELLEQTVRGMVRPPGFDVLAARGRRRRRVRRVVTIAAAASLVVVVGAGLLASDHDRGDVAGFATQPSDEPGRTPPDLAQRMSRSVQEAAGDHLGGLVGPVYVAEGGNGEQLPPAFYQYASSHTVRYRSGDRILDDRISSEGVNAEAPLAQHCEGDQQSSVVESCQVRVVEGHEVVIEELILYQQPSRPRDGEFVGVPPDALARARADGFIDLSRPWAVRQVSVMRGIQTRATVDERVPVETATTTGASWQTPVDAMIAIALDPEVVMAKPPIGSNGCPFMRPDVAASSTCSTS